VITTILNILNADRWRAALHEPLLVLGHSIGEVAAAYAAGMFTIDEAVRTAQLLGRAGATCTGAMAHVQITRDELDVLVDDTLCVAALNGLVNATPHADGDSSLSVPLLSVSLCGPTERVDAWLRQRPDAKRLVPQHPWHHPVYLEVPSICDGSALATLPASRVPPSAGVASATPPPTFVSSVRSAHVEVLDAAYWCAWLTTTIDFHGALERVALALAAAPSCYLIETGAHPVLTLVASTTLLSRGVSVVASAASMERGQPSSYWQSQHDLLQARLEASRAHIGSLAASSLQGFSSADVRAASRWALDSLNSFMHVDDIAMDSKLMELGMQSSQVFAFAARLTDKGRASPPITALDLIEIASVHELGALLLARGWTQSSIGHERLLNAQMPSTALKPRAPRHAAHVDSAGSKATDSVSHRLVSVQSSPASTRLEEYETPDATVDELKAATLADELGKAASDAAMSLDADTVQIWALAIVQARKMPFRVARDAARNP
jgi:hypothetical protein